MVRPTIQNSKAQTVEGAAARLEGLRSIVESDAGFYEFEVSGALHAVNRARGAMDLPPLAELPRGKDGRFSLDSIQAALPENCRLYYCAPEKARGPAAAESTPAHHLIVSGSRLGLNHREIAARIVAAWNEEDARGIDMALLRKAGASKVEELHWLSAAVERAEFLGRLRSAHNADATVVGLPVPLMVFLNRCRRNGSYPTANEWLERNESVRRARDEIRRLEAQFPRLSGPWLGLNHREIAARIVRAEAAEEDARLAIVGPPLPQEPEKKDTYMRPFFAEIIGQTDAVKRLATLVALHRRSSTALGHVLLVGPEGGGKRTITHAIARELGVNLREAEASSIERAGDLAAIIADLDRGDLLLIRAVNRIRRDTSEILSQTMRTFELKIVVGKGRASRNMTLQAKQFTCIGTVTSESECPRELRNAFDTVIRLQAYQPPEMLELTARALTRAGLSVEVPTIQLIARLAAGNPKKAQSIVGTLAALGNKTLSHTESEEILSAYGYIAGGQNTPPGDVSNLTNLSGMQFERLITELLEKMGFRAEMTKATGDGGIDIEAVLDRPIVGGRYLIQCKRFAPESLVGSPTVREFYGAITADRKAVKGILITTSGFTSQALEFADGLPIELIDGQQLGQMPAEYRTRKPPESC